MPKYDNRGLETYVRKHAVSATAADRALAVAAPFLAIDPQRAYPFARAGDLDIGEVAKVLWGALQKPMHRCWFQHAQSPLPDADRFDLKRGLVSGVNALYGDKIGYAFACNDDFRCVFYDAMTDRLHDAMAVASDGAIDPKHHLYPGWIVSVVLQYQIGLHAAAAPEAEDLLPLTQLLLRAIPLGEELSKPGNWCLAVL